jgi:hypothetical protein
VLPVDGNQTLKIIGEVPQELDISWAFLRLAEAELHHMQRPEFSDQSLRLMRPVQVWLRLMRNCSHGLSFVSAIFRNKNLKMEAQHGDLAPELMGKVSNLHYIPWAFVWLAKAKLYHMQRPELSY